MTRSIIKNFQNRSPLSPKSAILGLIFGIAATVAFSGSSALAATGTGFTPSCAPNPNGDLAYQQIVVSGSTATAQITNTSGGCSYSVGLAAYKTYVQFNGSNAHEYIYTQTLFDDDVRSLAPGQSATLQVSVPSCNYQLDLFAGSYSPVPPDFAALTGTHTLFPNWNQRHDLGVCGQTPQPITADIKANGSDGPITVPYGASANITWTSQNATSCTVTPGGWTGTSGSHSSGSLYNARTYNLNCTGPAGSASDSVTIYVDQQPPTPPPSVDIKANGSDGPVTIPYNSSANITWTSQNATYCSVSPSGWTGVSGGQPSGNLASSRTYSVNCTGSGGSASDSVMVNVQNQQTPVSCSPQSPTAQVGNPVSFTASGGDGFFWWSTFDGSPGSGSGPTFQTYFFSPGTKTVTAMSGNTTGSCTVQVSQPAVPPTADIKANSSDGPVTIPYNTSASISWTSQNATVCTVTPDGWTGISGSQLSGNLTGSRTYSVNCTGPGGSATDQVTVNVDNQQLPPTADIKANGSDTAITIQQYASAQIAWTSTNATSCTVSPNGWSGISGSQSSGGLSYSQTYSVNCTGPGGSASDSVTVNIQNQQPAPTADIKANGSDYTITIPYNNQATISWSSTNATYCTVSPNGWTGTYGSQSSGSFTYSRTYSVNCTGPGGSASDTVTVNVTQPNLPTVDIYANPRNINQGQSSLLSWTSQNADTCSASNGWSGGKSTYGSESVSPSYTTTYRITCSNQYGIAEDTDTVTVNTYIYNNPTNLQVTKNSLNRTSGQTTYSNFIEAQSQDVIEFEIRVRNTDSSSGSVTVRDLLPQELIYVPGSTRVNGNAVSDGITSGGISLGYMSPNEEKTVRFQATVLPGTSARTITNQASATMNSGLQTAYATVQVKSRGQVLGAADIVTGPENAVPWVLSLGFIASIVMYFLLFGRAEAETDPQIRIFGRIDSGIPAETAESEFNRMISEIRSRERRPDTEKKRKFGRFGA